jgi:hypothetical protein
VLEATDVGSGSDRRDPSVCRLTLAAARARAVRRGSGRATDAGLATVAAFAAWAIAALARRGCVRRQHASVGRTGDASVVVLSKHALCAASVERDRR